MVLKVITSLLMFWSHVKTIIEHLLDNEVRCRMLRLGYDGQLLLPLNPKSIG
ncbi:hypothetical protein D3C81_388220 [compost metagenome]